MFLRDSFEVQTWDGKFHFVFFQGKDTKKLPLLYSSQLDLEWIYGITSFHIRQTHTHTRSDWVNKTFSGKKLKLLRKWQISLVQRKSFLCDLGKLNYILLLKFSWRCQMNKFSFLLLFFYISKIFLVHLKWQKTRITFQIAIWLNSCLLSSSLWPLLKKFCVF